MPLSMLNVIAVLGMLALVLLAVWIIKIILRVEKYTRERFAFVALAGLFALTTTILSSLSHKETPWGAVMNLIRNLRGLPSQTDPPRATDDILMVVVFYVVSNVTLRFYESWNGAVSLRQSTKDRFHEPAPLLSEGLFEAKRIIQGDPPLEIRRPDDGHYQSNPLEWPVGTLAWHIQARDLICLRCPSYSIDTNQDWHDEERCWIGVNKKSSAIVAIRCENHQISHNQIVRFLDYVIAVAEKRGASVDNLELTIAFRSTKPSDVVQVRGYQVRCESENSLLDGLVDFADYFSEIRRRVNQEPLPDSSLTIAQVYTSSSCRDEMGHVYPSVEEYLRSWLAETGTRQLALLGDFGQGKSTTALMTAYNLIETGADKQRIPILIQLRGKSPRNMTPEDIIAGWAYPYRINPVALMNLLRAGRVFLILEGFDEMALVGDSETRLAHFRTLWKFCFPAAKILITGRPNFFLDDGEMRAALGISKTSAAGPYCEAVLLNPFTVQQIHVALRSYPNHVKEEIVDLAASDSKFREIVSRGSLLYVVSQLWEREKLSEHRNLLTSAFVMDLFVQHSYRRQTQKSANSPDFMVLNEGERRYFMEGIAAFMGVLELPNQITREQFERAVKTLYESIPSSTTSSPSGLPQNAQRPLRQRLQDAANPIEDVANDVRSSGLLVVDEIKVGALRFAHKSFMEYLMAKAYSDCLVGKNRESGTSIVAASHLNARHLLGRAETLAFLAEIFLGSIMGSEPFEGSLSKQLFTVIVVGRYPKNLVSKFRASVALQDLRLRALMESQRGAFLYRVFVPFSSRYFYTTQGLFLLGVACLAMVFRLQLHHNPTHTFIFLLGNLCGIGFVLLMTSNLTRNAAVRLWFICCVSIGLPHSDIAIVTGGNFVEPIAKFLGVQKKLRT